MHKEGKEEMGDDKKSGMLHSYMKSLCQTFYDYAQLFVFYY